MILLRNNSVQSYCVQNSQKCRKKEFIYHNYHTESKTVWKRIKERKIHIGLNSFLKNYYFIILLIFALIYSVKRKIMYLFLMNVFINIW